MQIHGIKLCFIGPLLSLLLLPDQSIVYFKFYFNFYYYVSISEWIDLSYIIQIYVCL